MDVLDTRSLDELYNQLHTFAVIQQKEGASKIYKLIDKLIETNNKTDARLGDAKILYEGYQLALQHVKQIIHEHFFKEWV